MKSSEVCNFKRVVYVGLNCLISRCEGLTHVWFGCGMASVSDVSAWGTRVPSPAVQARETKTHIGLSGCLVHGSQLSGDSEGHDTFTYH